MKKIIITRSQLNEMMGFDIKNLKKVQNKIYRTVSDYCGKMHSDSAWQDVKTLIGMIESVDGVEDVIVGAGEYFNYTNPEKGAHRDYETTVITTFGKLYGYIRCHAAGTMDDIFKYYDMTISLYPDKKRDLGESKIIKNDKGEIVPEKCDVCDGKIVLQIHGEPVYICKKCGKYFGTMPFHIPMDENKVNEVMDSQKTLVNFDGSNANELGANAQEKYNDALRTGLKPNSITLQGKTKNNNASDNDETIISFNTDTANIKDAVTNSVQNAVNNGADINKLNVQGNAEDILNGTNEAKVYSKRNVELARLHEIKKNGKRMTKKQLNEEIQNSIELKSKMSKMNMFKVLDAFSQTFGDDELEGLSTRWDMLDAITEMYENANPELQEKFCMLLGF